MTCPSHLVSEILYEFIDRFAFALAVLSRELLQVRREIRFEMYDLSHSASSGMF
jgi:hypothetical protein